MDGHGDDINSLGWLHTEEGKDWLKHAPLANLVWRQCYLWFHESPRRPDAREQYDIIGRAIRGGRDCSLPAPEDSWFCLDG
jgi:hypothetical protein